MNATGTEGITSTGLPNAETSQTVAAGQLRAFLERIERLEEEKKTIADDIKDVYAEAKGTGFDTGTLRAIIKMRKQDPSERAEKQTILELYLIALGMLPERTL